MRRIAQSAIALIALMALASGCFANDSARSAPPPGIPNQMQVQAAPAPVKGKSGENPWASRREPSLRARPSSAAVATTADPTATQGAATAPVAPKERDLSDELRGMIGNPGACLTQHTAGTGPSTLRLDVTAMVMPSGLITRATVRGAGLGPQESTCLEASVIRGRLRGPVEGAPRNVQTTIELHEQPPHAKPVAAGVKSP
jgi:hypothetical protein